MCPFGAVVSVPPAAWGPAPVSRRPPQPQLQAGCESTSLSPLVAAALEMNAASYLL